MESQKTEEFSVLQPWELLENGIEMFVESCKYKMILVRKIRDSMNVHGILTII